MKYVAAAIAFAVFVHWVDGIGEAHLREVKDAYANGYNDGVAACVKHGCK